MRKTIILWMVALTLPVSAIAAGQVVSGMIKVSDAASAVPNSSGADPSRLSMSPQLTAASGVAATPEVPASVVASPVPVEPPKKKRMKMPGVGGYVLEDRNSLPPVVVPVGNDGTRVIKLSKVFPNRISTPFSAPQVIDNTNVAIRQEGSSLYISPKIADPFVIFIKGDEPGDQVISLTIIPRDIPSQTIVLQADAPTVIRQQKTDSYTQQIVDLLRRVANGKTPEGFSEGRMPNAFAVNGELAIIPQIRYSGSWVDIYRYSVINNSNEAVELSETSFYRKGVRAVSIFPNLTLQPGEKTEVFVIADKTALDGGVNGLQ